MARTRVPKAQPHPSPAPNLRKTTVAVDDAAALSAQHELGTRTLTATVNAALREIAARAARRRFVEQMSAGAGTEAGDAEVMRSAWR